MLQIDGGPTLSGIIAPIQQEPAIIISSHIRVTRGERVAELVTFNGRDEKRSTFRFVAPSGDSTLAVLLKSSGAEWRFFAKAVSFI